MATDPAIRDHQAWLGYLQPDGLVVSASALVDAQVILDKNTLPLQQRFLPFVEDVALGDDVTPAIADIPKFVREFLEWPDECLFGLDSARPLPDGLTIPLPEFGEMLAPTLAFRDPRPKDPESPWLLLVQMLPVGTDLDAAVTGHEAGWSASRSRRFERLLRETKVPIGLVSNRTHIRLLYAPRGENAGSLTFPVGPMTEVAGRPILAALHLLLHRYQLLAAPGEARLPALLIRSREYQSRVSTALAQQVLDALYELLRGFQAANERTQGELLREVFQRDPNTVYHGLLTVLMRLVFLLFAEDRALLPTSPLYVQHYSVHGLFERLRVDQERYPDTMDHRYGAWAQLLALFRVVHNGCKHPQMKMPVRSGYLFDPDRFPFLEGRTCAEHRLPLISDGAISRILENLLLLDGERLSYRTLDVEEIGSVYQTVMGFRLEVAAGRSIAIMGKRKHRGEVAAATVINLDALLAAPGDKRLRWLSEQTDQDLSGEAEKAFKVAASPNELLASLERKIARNATPHVAPQGAMVLQPTDERRRSGSHYTPRSLTEPIVRTTLRPVLERLGPNPTPEQVLGLKVCDLAMGSGAFLVETCRQLGDKLVKAWHAHGKTPVIPADEDEVLHARRLVAQSCLYGVDRNPMAVDLAKLSLWLATLAKDHPFTFLDHSFRPGDSLVGLNRAQIAGFHWHPTAERVFGQDRLEKKIERVSAYRREILEGGDWMLPALKRQKLELADDALKQVREAADLVVASFFGGDKDKKRAELRNGYLDRLTTVYRGDLREAVELNSVIKGLRRGQFPIIPFHWEIDFPEVFNRENPGFDAIVGNPPFAGKNTLISNNRMGYLDWLKALHEESHGNADLVAHFFRRAFCLVRKVGCFGLIATNTIGQGDTRATGLRWICTHRGTIYGARKRYRWPGQAAVVVSIVWIARGNLEPPFNLDGRPVPIITAYLFHKGGHDNPAALQANSGRSFQGSIVLGMGFTFDDTDKSGAANPTALMRDLLARNRRNSERIFPLLGGEELSEHPTQSPHRFVIKFEDMTEAEARQWPDLMQIIDERVRPTRERLNDRGGREKWWQFLRPRNELYSAIRSKSRILVNALYGTQHAFVFQDSRIVFSNKINVTTFELYRDFAVLQSRCHELWARFFSSTLKDDLAYAPTDCFETFPFPEGFETDASLDAEGRAYYEHRAALMVDLWFGLTETYNLFHSPDDDALARLEALFAKRASNAGWRAEAKVPAQYSPFTVYPTPAAALDGIRRLRELHAAVDSAVLNSYSWADLIPRCTCEFLLDYEEDEEEGQSKKKKPWRYRWPDEVRDEVLARLIALNAQRAEEERLAGLAAGAGRAAKSKGRKGAAKKSAKALGQQELM